MYNYKKLYITSAKVSCSLILQLYQEIIESAGDEEAELAKEVAESFMNEVLPANEFGEPKAGIGQWASSIQVISPSQVWIVIL